MECWVSCRVPVSCTCVTVPTSLESEFGAASGLQNFWFLSWMQFYVPYDNICIVLISVELCLPPVKAKE